MKSIKFYIVKDFTNDLLSKTKTKFDLYTCHHNTTIKGGTLVVPSFSIHVKELNRSLSLDVNVKMYEKLFGVAPVYNVTDTLNYPIYSLPDELYRSEDYIRDVKWTKGIAYKDLEVIFKHSLINFIMKEFGDGLILHEDDVDVVVQYIKEMDAVNVEFNLILDKEDLIKLSKNASYKFSPLLRSCGDETTGLINFVE